MERALWTPPYSTFGRFTCPRCQKGKFREKDELTLEEEPYHETRELEEIGLVGEVSVGRFTKLLKCNNKVCGEIAAVSGDYRNDYEQHHDYETGEPQNFTIHSYRPFCFRPAPAIITVPKSLSNDIKPHIQRAFELFWSDHGSCANRLRIIVEMVLDQLQVPRKGPKGKHNNCLWDLADRISELNRLRPGHDEVLDALRNVGNTGSHDGVVDFEDLLDCFELLEYALIELLEQRREKLAEKARQINARKGKPGP